MKTLKFMLAAATAIGLASASHAAGEWVEEFNTSGDFPNGDVNWVAPADNESTVADGVLNVSVGTDPLTRMLSPSAGYAQAVDMTADDFISATITTDVKFTVTPAADDVTSSDGDKLLVYLKEDLTAGSEATNLMVKACNYKPGNQRTGEPASFTTNDYVVTASGVNVVPGDWYSLKVVAQKDNNNVVFFNLFIKEKNSESDYVPLVLASTLYPGDAENVKIPSLHGTANAGDATLTYVGFAGEGAIDNLAFSKEVQVSYIDFTLAWSGVTPVSYTVNGNEPVAIASDATSPLSLKNILEGGETVAFTFTNADGVTKTKDVVAAADGTISASASDFTWADYLGDAVAGAYTINDFNDLDMLRKGVAAGIATAGETFKQTANIDMASAGNFAGIGTYADNPTAGVAFCGTYDGQGYKISNVTFTDRDYAGIFNQVNGGTVQNLTVENLTFIGTGSKYCASIIGNAGNGATLKNLVATGSFGSAEKPGNHNMAGIAIRLSAGGTGTLVQNCTNNAAIYGNYTKLAGICAITQEKVSGGTVTFDGCVNNGSLYLSRTSTGVTGFAGIVGYVQDDTVLVGCSNTGSINNTANGANTDKNGALVGWAYAKALTDNGGNSAAKTDKMVGCQVAGKTPQSITGFKYATVANDVATTVTTLAAGKTYLLEGNVAASETAAFTLQAAGDTIAFDTALGYTFAGTVDTAAATLGVSSATAGTVTTYTAFAAVAQVNSGAKYATLQAAVDAATAGDTVTTLADCNITTPLSITKNLTVHTDHTITGSVNYAICIGATVSFEGSGKIQRASNITGSAFCVGANGGARGAVAGGTTGTLNFTGLTVCGGSGGNLIKLEKGTVNMNGGVLKDGLRGIKADADEGTDTTSTIVINGGTITNCTACAVMASAESATGTATVTINGGVIAGALDDNAGGEKQKGTHTITIPGTSTALFNADQSAFCAAGYETVLSDGWYVVRAVQAPADWDDNPSGITPGTSAATEYPALAESVLANADAAKLTTWAKANSVSFANVTTDPEAYEEAFLLDCAPADVEAEKAAFKADITFVDGVPVITPPAGKEYNVTPKLKGSKDLSDWTEVDGDAGDYKFFKLELSLQ